MRICNSSALTSCDIISVVAAWDNWPLRRLSKNIAPIAFLASETCVGAKSRFSGGRGDPSIVNLRMNHGSAEVRDRFHRFLLSSGCSTTAFGMRLKGVVTPLGTPGGAQRVRKEHKGRVGISWPVPRPGKPRSTLAYRLGQELQERTEGMLLLTATPMQLHPFELCSLVELLDPTLFPTYSDFQWHREHEIVWINNLISHLRDYEKLLPSQRTQLLPGIQAVLERHGRADLLEGTSLERFLGERGNRERLVEILAGFHKLSQVIIRNRKRVVGGFTEREARAIPVHLTEDEYRAYQRVTEWVRNEYSEAMLPDNNAVGFAMVIFQQLLTSSRYALMGSLSRRIDASEPSTLRYWRLKSHLLMLHLRKVMSSRRK